MNVLKRILTQKRAEVRSARSVRTLAQIRKAAYRLPAEPGRFEKALRRSGKIAVIAEIKRRSPSKGLIRKDFRPEWIARRYAACGACALSVLTDKRFFGGSLAILKRVRKAVGLPILRKDFIVDAYQLYEAKLAGADAVLLIAAALPKRKLISLSREATKLGLDVLFEVHDRKEMAAIRPAHPRLVGINNRDLKTFRVDLGVTSELSRLSPRGALLVSESGIFSSEDIRSLETKGVKAVLVGEALMREKDPGAALKKLLGDSV